MMATHPEVQRKAQAEIDVVVGSGRLPNINDREALPYVNHLIIEVLRINPIAPLVPHSLDQDDVCTPLYLSPLCFFNNTLDLPGISHPEGSLGNGKPLVGIYMERYLGYTFDR